MFHYFFVVHAVPDIDIGVERNGADGGVKVHDVGDVFLGVEVGVDALHEGGLAGAYR